MTQKFLPRENPELYEINTAAWLFELSQKMGKKVLLKDVPSAEWDKIKDLGMDFVWLMGVWSRSVAGRKISLQIPEFRALFESVLPGCQEADIIGSCYAIGSGDPDPLVGSWKDIDYARSELHKRNMGLILDFIPNHRGIDHPWIAEHPEYFIQVSQTDYQKDKESYFPVNHKGQTLHIAHGRDPNFPAWTDTAQLNYFNPETRIAMIHRLEQLAAHCDGVRCDMAMLVLNDIFQKTWGWTNRNPHFTPPAQEFWAQVTQHVPDLVYIAEAYWDTEWTLQQLGFDFVYDKRLYDRLREASPHEILLHLNAGLDYQNKLVRFIENHDELRSAAVFKKEKLPAVAALFSGLPGMKLYFQGQFEGRQIRLPIQIRQTRPEEIDPEIKAFYDKLLPVVNAEICHAGAWSLKQVFPDGEDTAQNLIAYSWRLDDQLKLFMVNLDSAPALGRVSFQEEVSELHDYAFVDNFSGEKSIQNGKIMAHPGLRFKLAGYQARIMDIVRAQ